MTEEELAGGWVALVDGLLGMEDKKPTTPPSIARIAMTSTSNKLIGIPFLGVATWPYPYWSFGVCDG